MKKAFSTFTNQMRNEIKQPASAIVETQWRVSWKLMLALTLGTPILGVVLILIFPRQTSAEAEQLANVWPEVIRNLFGDPVMGFSTLAGWLNLQYFHVTHWVIFGIFAALRCADLVGGDAERKRLELLLYYPVGRGLYLGSGVAAVISQLVTASLALFVGIWVGLLALKEGHLAGPVAAIIVSALPLVILIGLVALLLSTLLLRSAPAVLLTFAVTFGFFFIEEVVQYLHPGLAWMALASPFHYYRSGDVLLRGAVNWINPALLLISSAALFFLSLAAFNRKELAIS